jgi:predicted DNA-binding protein
MAGSNLVQLGVRVPLALKRRLNAVSDHPGHRSYLIRQALERLVEEREAARRQEQEQLAKAS